MNHTKLLPMLCAISRNSYSSPIYHRRNVIGPVDTFYILNSNTAFGKNELDRQTEHLKHEENLNVSAAEDIKKNKKKKQPVIEVPLDIRRYDFKIGRVLQVDKHPAADSLYVQKINCGEPNPRNVVSGLVKHVSTEELKDRLVVVLCNVKPAKMRGIPSEAMVMCATSSDDKVEILEPPSDSIPGDVIECPGFPRQPDTHLKSRVTSLCAPDLLINQHKQACYKQTPLMVVGKGPIVVKTLTGVNFK